MYLVLDTVLILNGNNSSGLSWSCSLSTDMVFLMADADINILGAGWHMYLGYTVYNVINNCFIYTILNSQNTFENRKYAQSIDKAVDFGNWSGQYIDLPHFYVCLPNIYIYKKLKRSFWLKFVIKK